MSIRPYVLLSCAMSIDGYIDDATDRRLVLSDAADLDRVDELRAGCDAILVGANTIRRDDPRLLVRSEPRRSDRARQGLPADPLKVTVTASGDLDPDTRFFTAGVAGRIVYCPSDRAGTIRARHGDRATVVAAGSERDIDLARVLDDLGSRGVRRLLVEGGCSVHTAFLTSRLADELQLVIAPFFVGDSRAPRFVGDGRFVDSGTARMRLLETRQIGDQVLLRYQL